MAPAPAAAVVAIVAPVSGNVPPAVAGSGESGVVDAVSCLGTDGDDVSGGGTVLPPGDTVSEVVGGVVGGMGLPAFDASRMLRIAGPDQTSAAPTPIAVVPPRTKSRRERPAGITTAEPVSAPSTDVSVGGMPVSGRDRPESSTFATGSPFPVHVLVTTRAVIIPARCDFTPPQ
jgi:hypothetical protein